jgi:hypothetical protein
LSKDVIDEKLTNLRTDQAVKWQALFEAMHPNDSSTLPPDFGVEMRKVAAGSPIAGKPLFETGLRTKTGTTVVAIMRGEGQLIPNPRAEEVIQAEDVLILMGSPKQLSDAAVMFAPVQSPREETPPVVPTSTEGARGTEDAHAQPPAGENKDASKTE